ISCGIMDVIETILRRIKETYKLWKRNRDELNARQRAIKPKSTNLLTVSIRYQVALGIQDLRLRIVTKSAVTSGKFRQITLSTAVVGVLNAPTPRRKESLTNNSYRKFTNLSAMSTRSWRRTQKRSTR